MRCSGAGSHRSLLLRARVLAVVELVDRALESIEEREEQALFDRSLDARLHQLARPQL
jgi:hypothetical protein